MSNIELLFIHNKKRMKHINLYIFVMNFRKKEQSGEISPKLPHRTLFSFVYIV